MGTASEHASVLARPLEAAPSAAGRSRAQIFARPRVVLFLSVGVWFALVCVLAVKRYGLYLGGRFDLGNMVQAVWNTAHGRPLEVTLATGEQTSRLAAHADIFLAALAPLWVVFPSPVTLLIVQAAALALGALPVYWLARKHIGSDKAALFMAWAYLLYPWLAWGAMNDFHSVTVGSSFLLFAIWALDSDRLVLFFVFALAALTTHELVGLLVAGLGVWYALARGHRTAGAAIAVCGLGWTVVCLKLVIPHFADGHSPFYGRFASTGGSPAGIVETLVTDPVTILRATTSGEDVVYVLLLILPLAGLLVLSPAIALAASPLLAMNLLSDWSTTTNPLYQYTTPLIPFLVVATIFGVARFSSGRARRASFVALVAGAFFVVLGPTWAVLTYDFAPSRADALHDAIALVPPSATLSATQHAGGHLSARRVIYSFPTIRDATWVLVDRRDLWTPELPGERRALRPQAVRAAFARLEHDARFRLVFKRDLVELYRRVAVAS